MSFENTVEGFWTKRFTQKRNGITENIYVQGDAKGFEEWYKDGKPHRINGPAVTYPNGIEFWYKEGERHREDGPAVTYEDGSVEYWLNGEFIEK